MNQGKKTIRRPKSWYVLLHLEPELVELQLQRENEERKRKRQRLFEYFIPYLFLPKAVPDDYAQDIADQRREAKDSNDLRRTMHHFVFIKASQNEITRLVSRPWNREGRLHLFFYISREGRRITMPDKMMESFITLCCENKQRFTFSPAIQNIEDYDSVVIATGTFKDTEAKILDVQHTTHGVSVTLAIPFFNGEKTLTLPGYKPEDLHLPRTVETLLSDHFIDAVEEQLIAILDRRVKRPWDIGNDKTEAATLNHLFHYSYVHMPDLPSHHRFRALMLICATLRHDTDSRLSLIREVQGLLKDTDSRLSALDSRLSKDSRLSALDSRLSSESTAYLQAALYLATGDADYRTAAKTYQQHPEAAPSLTRLLSPLKRMNKSLFKSLGV